MSNKPSEKNSPAFAFVGMILLLVLVWSATDRFMVLGIDPDDTQKAHDWLERERQAVRLSGILAPAQKAGKLLDLGLWQEAENALGQIQTPDDEARIVKTRLLILNNEFTRAEKIVSELLNRDPENRRAALLLARLKIEAWLLGEAAEICATLLHRDDRDEEAALLLGKVRLLEKNYDEALDLAKKVQRWNKHNAAAYLLESDVHFWKQNPELAEAPLGKSLRLDPFNADARFNYGYSIWRRVDATQLDAMAAQWELALQIDPLHYLTHWHWGNGHTNLTYADYIHTTDEEVREKLKPVDELISKNRIEEAISLSRKVETEFPESVLPTMIRGSAFYMAYDLEKETRLDSAQAIFQQILQIKKSYGPAHNALAAVIKQKRFSYLAAYDSLTAVIDQTEITDLTNFARIFPDANYYPGDRVQKMVWNSLYESKVYFPFLAKLGRKYVIPPLHIDLAIAMKSPYFRQATTFDNRQWMDIRGVGSGASAIEYVERGAHLERNVVLHEYVHLFHGAIFTDWEKRRVRQLYYNAMKSNATLDYYSANNESEYLAQTYPAYFEPVKVHPLNHKSVNTTSDLKSKDPHLYAFLDSLVERQRAYSAGEKQALASNWAQVYVSLSERATRRGVNEKSAKRAAAILDTALVWDPNYLPAFLCYASLRMHEKKFADAETWLKRAEEIDANYAPIYVAFADLERERLRAGFVESAAAIRRQAQYFEKALALEADLAMRARVNRRLREFYLSNVQIPDGIRTAQDYVATAPTVSTYLRDRRDEALTFANWLRGSLGYPEPIAEFERLVSSKPQHYQLLEQYAEVLEANDHYHKAIRVLEEAQRILTAAGTPSPQFAVKMIDYKLALGDTTGAREGLEAFESQGDTLTHDRFRLVRVYAAIGQPTKAERELSRLDKVAELAEPYSRSEYQFALGTLWQSRNDREKAIEAFGEAVQLNPYHFSARLSWILSLVKSGRHSGLEKIVQEALQLATPPGPALRKKMTAAIPRTTS